MNIGGGDIIKVDESIYNLIFKSKHNDSRKFLNTLRNEEILFRTTSKIHTCNEQILVFSDSFDYPPFYSYLKLFGKIPQK